MHELGLAQDVLHKLLEEGTRRGLAKLSLAKVNIGETLISHPQEFRELFTNLAKGTVAEGIDLQLEILPLKAVCGKCHKGFDSEKIRFDCPHCGSMDVKLTSGTEIEIVDLK